MRIPSEMGFCAYFSNFVFLSPSATGTKSYARECYHEEERRSYSLDGDLILGPNLIQQLEKGKNKSAWSKVKGIVTNRNSRKSMKSTGSMNSRDVSPIEIGDRDRTDSLSSSNQPSPSQIGGFNLSIPDNDYGGTSSGYSHHMSSDDNEAKASESQLGKSSWLGKKGSGSRKSKHVPEIESLLEGVPLESKYNKKPIPIPLNLQRVSEVKRSKSLSQKLIKAFFKALTNNYSKALPKPSLKLNSVLRISVNQMASTRPAEHPTHGSPHLSPTVPRR